MGSIPAGAIYLFFAMKSTYAALLFGFLFLYAGSQAGATSISDLDTFLDSITPRGQTPVASPEMYSHETPGYSRPSSMESWVNHFRETSSMNDLSYMFECFEHEVTDIKTGKTTPLSKLVGDSYAYVNRWVNRRFDVVDYKIRNNRIEIRSRYRCSNASGKTVTGYCKTTWIISPAGRIAAMADDSSTSAMPAFSAEVQGYDASVYQPGSLSAQDARRFAEMLLRHYGSNDLSYIRYYYAPEVTDIKTGKRISIDQYIRSMGTYIGRWGSRSCALYDYAWRGNRVEIRMRYTCTNYKGKTVTGYCKTTWLISPSGKIEGYADDSSRSILPDFSPYVGAPVRW